MKELINLGLEEKDLLNILEVDSTLKDISEEEVLEKINILKNIKCTEREIRNIISSNPLYLNRINKDVVNLLKKLNELGFSSISTLLDSNPFILNIDVFELDNYIKSRKELGDSLENIINDLDDDPYLFNDI